MNDYIFMVDNSVKIDFLPSEKGSTFSKEGTSVQESEQEAKKKRKNKKKKQKKKKKKKKKKRMCDCKSETRPTQWM